MSGMIVDLFAGGGGTSLGIEMALGRSPDVAINHDPEAVAMHAVNHPKTRHYCEDIWSVSPEEATGGRPVALLWASPDCTHFSRAKGGKPISRRRRVLAHVIIRWAREVRPSVIALENVSEFLDFGPVHHASKPCAVCGADGDGRPCPIRRGRSFRRWVSMLRNLGYRVDWRELVAADYGAPTSRRRLYLIARRDGKDIEWPETTHGPFRLPYRTAAECIDWEVPCPSIFGRVRPLAEATMRRIARGVRRYVLGAADPFVVGGDGLLSPSMIHVGNGEHVGQAPRTYNIRSPLGTVVASGQKHALVAAYLAKHYGGHEATGSDLREPMATVTTQDHHALVRVPFAAAGGDRRLEVRAFLMAYYGVDQSPEMRSPMPTVTTHDRFGLVTVAGQAYEIADIGMRMLLPRELYRAQGFPDSYQIDIDVGGRPLSKSAQVRLVGNSVSPPVAAAIVRANMLGVGAADESRQLALFEEDIA